ncbi:MAG: hypothetical protein Ct9H300mP15_13630 [Gemmatimonadota bacterium]|nr:MAG: hypothetical protein Ct9H300mP15_13630 [Gemmatimonadota bacterium]
MIGGAQTDCWTLEHGFDRWPEARWTHVYGGSEVEPVACVDAREAVAKSRGRDRFQALFVGLRFPWSKHNPSRTDFACLVRMSRNNSMHRRERHAR